MNRYLIHVTFQHFNLSCVFWHQISLLFIGNYQCYIRAFTLIHFLVSFINKNHYAMLHSIQSQTLDSFCRRAIFSRGFNSILLIFLCKHLPNRYKVGELFNAFYLHKNLIISINCVRVMSYTHISLKPGLTFSKLQIQLQGGFTRTF